jgi:phage anti-repressor protein
MALYVNIDQAKEKEMYKKLEKRMAIAAFILLAFFVSRQMLTVNIMGDYAEMSSIINLAGSQRMLSQKIAKDVAMLRPDIDIDRRDHYIVELARTVEIFTEQDALLLSEDHSAVVEHMYEDISETKDKLITSAMTILSYSQNQDGGAISEFNEARITILTTEDNFLMQMDAIVDQYEWEAREAFAWIGRIENIFFAIQIGLLVLVSIIVFIPAHKTFKSMYEEAKENNDNMLRLFHIMRNALFLLDKEGNIQTYNKKAENLLGKIGLDSDIRHIRDLFQKSSNDWTQVVELIGPDGTSGMIEVDFNQKEDWEEGSDQIIAMELSVTSGTYRGRESRLLNFYDVTSVCLLTPNTFILLH